MDGLNLSSSVTTEKSYNFDQRPHKLISPNKDIIGKFKPKIVVIDFGVKMNILRHLVNLDAEVTVLSENSTIEDIKDSDNDKLTKIEGIEEDTAKELIERAKEFYKKDQEEISNRVKNLGLDNQLIDLPGLTPGMLVTLGEQKILTINDFADLASDELTGTYDVVNGEKIKIKGYLEEFALTKQEADNLIMSARDIVYKN